MLELSGIQLHQKCIQKELSCEEIVRGFIREAKQESFGALLSILEERALKKAKKIDQIKFLFRQMPA